MTTKNEEEHPLVVKFRSALLKRGVSGIKHIGMYFQQMDENHNLTLTLFEFKNGIINHNLSMKEQEIDELFKLFDKNNEGVIDYEEFIKSVRVETLLI